MLPYGVPSMYSGLMSGAGIFTPGVDRQVFIPAVCAQSNPPATAGIPLYGVWSKPRGAQIVRVQMVGPGGGGGSGYPLSITAYTSTPQTLTSNSFSSNTGSSIDIVFNLPSSPAVGDVVEVFVTAAHYAKIVCPGSQQVYFGTTTCGAAGYWRSQSVGSSAFLVYSAANLWTGTVTGLWTVNS